MKGLKITVVVVNKTKSKVKEKHMMTNLFKIKPSEL